MKRLVRSVALLGVLAAGVWFGVHSLPGFHAGIGPQPVILPGFAGQ